MSGSVAEEGARAARHVMFHEHPVIQYKDASSLVKGGIVWVQDSTISSELFQAMIVEVHKQRMLRGTRRRKIETAFSVQRCDTDKCELVGKEIFVPLSHCKQVVEGAGAGGASGAGEVGPVAEEGPQLPTKVVEGAGAGGASGAAEVGPVAEEDPQLPTKREMKNKLTIINIKIAELYIPLYDAVLDELLNGDLLSREFSLRKDRVCRNRINSFQVAIEQYKELFGEDEFSATCQLNCSETKAGFLDIQKDLLAEITRRGLN